MMGIGQKMVFRMLLAGFAASAALTVGAPAEAQRTLLNTSGPAEQPPSSFRGDQYVDSEGCVFIRAGVGGATRWVPRVTRDRRVVCGQAPSAVARSAPAAPPVRTAEPVIRRTPAPAAPRQIAVAPPRRVATPPVTTSATTQRRAAPRPARVAAAPRPMPQAASAPSFAIPPNCGVTEVSARYLRNTPACAASIRAQAQGRAIQQPTIVTTPSTPRTTQRVVRQRVETTRDAQAIQSVTPPVGAVRVNPNAPSPARGRGGETVTRGCPGASAISARYLRNATRCGGDPNWSIDQRGVQQRSDAGGGVIGALLSTVSTRGAPATVIVPAARTTFGAFDPPPGYRAAFRDGRLNPNRGPRTLQGDFQSQAIWTNETPRRLRKVIYVNR